MDSALRILSLSIEFPTPEEPGKGLFIWARLQALSAQSFLKVLSPIALLDYANPHGTLLHRGKVPARRMDGQIEVIHPGWIYPPRGGFLNAWCLFLALLWPVYRLRGTFRFDLLDAHFGHPDGVAAALLSVVFRKPLVVTLRGSELLHGRYRLRRHWMAWAARRASRVITMSGQLAELASSWGASENRIRVIPNGVNDKLFYLRDRDACRRQYGIDPRSKVILSAGDLAELKGHHVTIQALTKLLRSESRAELLIAGGVGRSGQFAQRLREQVSVAGLESHVRFLGEVSQEQLAELMSAADVFCLASFREGWPNVVNEALACGTPVVATDVGSVRRMISDVSYGTIVPPRDEETLSRALGEGLARHWEREKISNWGSKRSWDHVASEVLTEMEEVIAEQLSEERPKIVIINADDLGISDEVNEAIFARMARGRITSATILANGPAVENVSREILRFSGCSFGVHLNLTEFAPLSRGPGTRLLTDSAGLMCRRNRGRRPSMPLWRAMYDELCAQMERVLALGVPISHLDSHHHVHTGPFVFPVVKAVQRRYGIRRIRVSKNIYAEDEVCGVLLRQEKRIFNLALRSILPSRTTQGFAEFLSFWRAARRRRIRQRTVELMVHPGHPGYAEETRLLDSDWQESLPFPVRIISYNEI
jgi:glycosyltransferase involved in cell wall biosynthesis/predicted glycoside hydrolase/deacetylase ChbG (UPF0249 family)